MGCFIVVIIIVALIVGYRSGRNSNLATVSLNQVISYHTLTFPTAYLQADQSLDKFFLPADLPDTNVLTPFCKRSMKLGVIYLPL